MDAGSPAHVGGSDLGPEQDLDQRGRSGGSATGPFPPVFHRLRFPVIGYDHHNTNEGGEDFTCAGDAQGHGTHAPDPLLELSAPRGALPETCAMRACPFIPLGPSIDSVDPQVNGEGWVHGDQPILGDQPIGQWNWWVLYFNI